MDDIQKEKEQQEAAKKKEAPDGGAPVVDDATRVKELEQENKELKQQVTELQKRVQELEAESQAAANRTRAQKLIAWLEKSGMPFGSDEERDKELNRLAGLSDDAFSATEAAFDRAIQTKSEDTKKESEADCGCNKTKPNAEADRQLRTDAGVRPADVDDKKLSLEDKLRNGFMTAYRERVGTASSGKGN